MKRHLRIFSCFKFNVIQKLDPKRQEDAEWRRSGSSTSRIQLFSIPDKHLRCSVGKIRHFGWSTHLAVPKPPARPWALWWEGAELPAGAVPSAAPSAAVAQWECVSRLIISAKDSTKAQTQLRFYSWSWAWETGPAYQRPCPFRDPDPAGELDKGQNPARNHQFFLLPEGTTGRPLCFSEEATPRGELRARLQRKECLILGNRADGRK